MTATVLVPAAVIASFAVLLTAGLSFLGILARLNLATGEMVAQGKGGTAWPKALPEWVVGLATVAFAFGISWAVLNVTGGWRRLLLCITSLVLLAGWAPVLGLAAHAPVIGGPFIAVLWSGICALVYAQNHQIILPESLRNESHEAR